MVKIPLDRVEENTEICFSERIKNSVKNFQLSLLVHLMILFQHSFKFFFFSIFPTFENFMNWKKLESPA